MISVFFLLKLFICCPKCCCTLYQSPVGKGFGLEMRPVLNKAHHPQTLILSNHLNCIKSCESQFEFIINILWFIKYIVSYVCKTYFLEQTITSFVNVTWIYLLCEVPNSSYQLLIHDRNHKEWYVEF